MICQNIILIYTIVITILLEICYGGQIDGGARGTLITQSLPTQEFEVNLNFGAQILEFNNQSDIFDISIRPKKKSEYHKDPFGFCQASPNMIFFNESPGSYTPVYPQYFNEEEELIDEDNLPPSLLAYHRANKKGLVAIDTDFNLISVIVNGPTEEQPYHQPEVEFVKSLTHMRPMAAQSDYPYISSLADQETEETTFTYLFFNDQVVSYDHEQNQFKNMTGWVPVAKIERLTIGHVNKYQKNNDSRPFIFVAAGRNGAYVYNIQESGDLKLVQYISSLFIGKEDNFEINFTDIDHQKGEESVYFLEETTGIHAFTIEAKENHKSVIIHNTKFGLHFSGNMFGSRVRHYSEYENNILKHQTFIAIVEQNNIVYTMEYLVNVQLEEWFLNQRKHHADIILEDVIVFKSFAILLGTNVHKVVYHSILQQYQTEQMDTIDKYSLTIIPGLVDSEFIIDDDHYDIEGYLQEDETEKLFLIGISKRNIVFINLQRFYPSIQCWPMYYNTFDYTDSALQDEDKANKKLEEKAYYYEITYFSRNCATKDKDYNKYSDYLVCKTTMNIVVELTDSWLTEDQMVWVWVILIFTLTFFIGCITFGYCKYKKQSNQHQDIQSQIKGILQKMKQQKKDKKTKKQYQPMQEQDNE